MLPLGFKILHSVKSMLDSKPLPYKVSVFDVMNSKLASVYILSELLSQKRESVFKTLPSFDTTSTFPKALILFSFSFTIADSDLINDFCLKFVSNKLTLTLLYN